MPKKKKLTQTQLDARAKGRAAFQASAAAAKENAEGDGGREAGGHPEVEEKNGDETDDLAPPAAAAPTAPARRTPDLLSAAAARLSPKSSPSRTRTVARSAGLASLLPMYASEPSGSTIRIAEFSLSTALP